MIKRFPILIVYKETVLTPSQVYLELSYSREFYYLRVFTYIHTCDSGRFVNVETTMQACCFGLKITVAMSRHFEAFLFQRHINTLNDASLLLAFALRFMQFHCASLQAARVFNCPFPLFAVSLFLSHSNM